MTGDLLGLRDWLKGLGVTHVAMEATGVYWKPVYYLLEDDSELLLVNAQHVKNVPGRKTDVQDAQWLCQLLEHGLLKSSFVPPQPIREPRDLTRYRKSLVWERGREANRLQKVLEDANIKLASVASRPLGVSGKAMLRAALEGRFGGHHALLVSHLLAHIEYLEETINSLSAEIEERVPRTQEGDRRRRPLDPSQRLPRAPRRGLLPRARGRLVSHPRRPQAHHAKARPPARTTRPKRYARARDSGGRMRAYF
jgi:transposase